MDTGGIRGFLFDLDGVLVNSMEFHAESFVRALGEEGISIDPRRVYELEGENDVCVMEDLLREEGALEDVDVSRLVERRREIFEQIEETEVFPGVLELISRLGDRFELGLVSGSARENVTRFVDRFFPGGFDCVIYGDETDEQKPDPGPYLRCLEGLSLEREEVLVVENAPLGVSSAKNAGLRCVAVATYLPPDALSDADLVFEDHEGLARYLDENFL